MCSELRRISVTAKVLQPLRGSEPAQISFDHAAGCRQMCVCSAQAPARAWEVCDSMKSGDLGELALQRGKMHYFGHNLKSTCPNLSR